MDIEGLTGPWQAENFGRIKLTKISLCRALQDEVSLKQICGAQAMYCLLYSLFERDGTLRSELNVDQDWTDLLVFQEMAIKRPFRTTAVVERAIETVIAFLGPKSLIVLQSSQGWGMDLTNDECMSLGLTAIPESPLFIRGPRSNVGRRGKSSKRQSKVRPARNRMRTRVATKS